MHLTDGRGALAAGRILDTGPPVAVRVDSLDRAVPGCRSVLLCGTPEGERADWMIEKLAELGLSTLIPIQCQRGSWERARQRGDRWRRLAMAALRQSRGRFLLDVRPPTSVHEALADLDDGTRGFIASAEGEPAGQVRAEAEGTVVGIVGPSGGFTPEERRSIVERGFLSMSLAQNRLRTETAAVAWVAWWATQAR